LFIVPWLAAGIWPGSACASAPSTTSVMRCEVSTLPAGDRRRRPGVDERVRRRQHMHRRKTAGVHRHILVGFIRQRTT
jgi:hypothetical protein